METAGMCRVTFKLRERGREGEGGREGGREGEREREREREEYQISKV